MVSTARLMSRRNRSNVLFGIPFRVALWIVPVSLCLGCGGGSKVKVEKLVPASGIVQLDGRPTPGIRLSFQPVSGTNAVGGYWAMTDDEGKFTVMHLSKKEGLPPGKYEVLLSRRVKPDGTPLGENESPTMVQSRESISKMFSDPAMAGLHNRVDVSENGNNSIEFKVTSVKAKGKV